MAFGGFEQTTAQPMSEINTTPLVDVMLVLLIIFMITAPLMTQTINVNLPKAVGAAVQEKPDIVNLAISAEGNISWNNEAVADDGLSQCLTELANKEPQPELHLIADKDVRYERVAQVMGLVRAAGVTKMGFVMLPGGPESAPVKP
jgi:biopolymer transport protein ExbD